MNEIYNYSLDICNDEIGLKSVYYKRHSSEFKIDAFTYRECIFFFLMNDINQFAYIFLIRHLPAW